jgi:WhiB family redox-sensing transcriptional regulator
MTERERRALLRRRPNVTSWREVLEAARDDYERVLDYPGSAEIHSLNVG